MYLRKKLIVVVFLLIILTVSACSIKNDGKNSNNPESENIDSLDGNIEEGEDWMLILVNRENSLPDNYSPKLGKLENGLEFDARAIEELNLMLSDAKTKGLYPIVCSAYRLIEYQQKLYDNQVNKEISRGLNRQKAESEASKAIAYPGTSEHNLGLAVDIVSMDYQILDEKQAETAEIKWLIKNCKEYGFILRYPKNKTYMTGVIYEPWHFRYVGRKAAKEIMENGLCLEEYLARY